NFTKWYRRSVDKFRVPGFEFRVSAVELVSFTRSLAFAIILKTSSRNSKLETRNSELIAAVFPCRASRFVPFEIVATAPVLALSAIVRPPDGEFPQNAVRILCATTAVVPSCRSESDAPGFFDPRSIADGQASARNDPAESVGRLSVPNAYKH